MSNGKGYFNGIVSYAVLLSIADREGVENTVEAWTTVKRRALNLAMHADELAQYAQERIELLEEGDKN